MKRGRRKGGSKEKVFGCDLVEHLTVTSQDIPQVLRSCSIFIEEHGIVDGIYRLSGVSSNTQKLRSEFDSEGSPDLNKDVYLQDIHCVSSLCKAYFRELPNPLLTYQLYEHFAEAVAVQLEDERLVKIKEVLKELPQPHFRTLEFLMRHLVRMATYSNQTNMHARNLAIVWAPNLLRSKDIESTGFNGTAAFMEVRVQSIVVEFILTHVSQLFPELDPETGPTSERRKSLPSPSILSNQDDPFFKALPLQYPGNMTRGDGPPKMTPYHAIIDGTDKRKGSLKGRKWKSIFNLGGRLHDPRKKKYAPKEKEKTSLRPAKSMDSLSPGHYAQEDSRQGSPQLSPLAVPPGPADGGPAGAGGVSSGYAVTYRRTGGASVSVVSGGGGAQGTYRSLDPGARDNAEKSQSLTQTTPSRAERRAGMHISGPFSVTVPLHITSGLVMGVLKGGRAEEEDSVQGPNDEEELKKDTPENAEEMETELDEVKVQIGSLNDNKKEKMDNLTEGEREKEDKREDREPEEARPEEREESGDQCSSEGDVTDENQHATDRPSVTEDTDGEDYMVMKGGVVQCPKEEEILDQPTEEEEYPDQELPLDFQDTFGFLDLMDMPTSNQLEFSVEPPAFEMDEYEEEDKQSPSQSDPHLETSLLSFPAHISRPISSKSHSLPYKSSPFQPALSFSSEEDCYSGPSDDLDSSDLDKDEYEDMFIKSLPADAHFQGLNWASPTSDSESNEESQSKNHLECLDQTHAVPEDIQGSLPTSQSPATDMIVSNAGERDLSPLPTETKLYSNNAKKQTNEERSTKNDGEDKSGFEELGDANEPIQEEIKKMESTDSQDETLSHKDNQSIEDENQEDTYFGPDPPCITAEPSNYSGTTEPSSTNDPVINEEPARSDEQRENTDGSVDVSESETTVDVTGYELQTTQNKSETDKLSVNAEIIQHTNMQELRDGNELEGVVVSDGREVSEEGEEERNAKETEEIIIIKEGSTESEHSEGEKDFEAPTNQIDVDKRSEKESDRLPQAEQMCLENKMEDIDVEKQKEGSDESEEDEQQMEEDDIEEEAEALKHCHLEGVAELKDGSVPEELSEDRLSEDGEEQPGEKEESMREEKHEKPSASDDIKEKPLRPPRMKDRDSGRGAALGLGVGRRVIISKHKIYQVKAVPVVPPKPQHSKLTAFKQQFQQRDTEKTQKPVQPICPERQHTDDTQFVEKESENEENTRAEIGDVTQNHDSHSAEEEKGTGTDSEKSLEENKAGHVRKQLKDTKLSYSLEGEVEEEEDREEQKQRRGTWDGGSLRKGGQKELDKEAKRTSAISMCFDEAVARATGKRYREKECIEKDRLVDLPWEKSVQKEGLNQRKKEEEEEKND